MVFGEREEGEGVLPRGSEGGEGEHMVWMEKGKLVGLRDISSPSIWFWPFFFFVVEYGGDLRGRR